MIKVPNKEYWIKRSELTLIQNEKSALQYEKDLKKAYQATIKQITKEIEAFYGRYAKENQITLLEARKRLTPKELLDFNQHAKIYLDEVERLGDKAFTAEYKAYLKELSGRAYVSRIEELITNIRHNIETLSTGYNIGLGQILTGAYQDGFYRTMFDIQKQAGFGVSFTTPGGKQLEMAIRERWAGQNYSDRIWTNKNKLIIQLEQMLSQEFVRGRGPREVAKDFSDKMQTSYHNAQRLIRTELNYISNKGTMKAYEESEVVDRYQYLATLDSRTSDICREMDGKVFTTKEGQIGVNIPPLHPHCRSTTIPYFEDDEISEYIEDRVARREDGTGKSYKLGKNVTFFEWVEQYGSPEFKKRVQEQRKRFLDMDKKPRTKKKQEGEVDNKKE
jgi:SPP1 gp7 family putative phage head morphogenesis protein